MKNRIENYRNLFEKRNGKSNSGFVETWDEISPKWIEELSVEGSGKKRTTLRVDSVAGYLREHGLLSSESTVADIGCGPGMFVSEFAKTAGRVIGFDFSKRFIEYGTDYANREGQTNVKFELCDFTKFDPDVSGYRAAFDLVFTSITPALTAEGSLAKIITMSRGHCFNTSHVFIDDNIARLAASEVFNADYSPRWNGEGFYALANLIWFLGYYPVTSYYDTEIASHPVVDHPLAAEIGFLLRRDSDEDIEKILIWLSKRCTEADSGISYNADSNTVERQTNTRYGSVLWDIRRKDERT